MRKFFLHEKVVLYEKPLNLLFGDCSLQLWLFTDWESHKSYQYLNMTLTPKKPQHSRVHRVPESGYYTVWTVSCDQFRKLLNMHQNKSIVTSPRLLKW
jgi:hypothetical protein